MIDILFIFKTLHTILGVSGCIFNVLLIYLAKFKSPSAIKSYATLIVNFAFTDFCVCFLDVFIEQRLIPAGGGLYFVSSGYCIYFGPYACHVGFGLMLHFLAHSLWSLLISFSYRFYVLYYPAPKKSTMAFILLLVYQPSLFQAVLYISSYNESNEVRETLQQTFPSYNLTETVVSGNTNILRFSALFTVLHMNLPIIPVYLGIILLRRKIIKRLTYSGVGITGKAKVLHKQLLLALTYQALLPGFYVFAVLSYACGQFGFIHHPALEYEQAVTSRLLYLELSYDIRNDCYQTESGWDEALLNE
ncbi:unnamed protein product [Caenorhabditis bovis]|uniref:G-protein coupled receptors family 1 profile domain-containing protein n=1 Tax=Caenorhabditis bovis TaxID=2654633 RepID=A0A8S1FBF0_9PELO|nr:unnamed protein product [Caenorhabditis bovis]